MKEILSWFNESGFEILNGILDTEYQKTYANIPT